MTPVLSCAGVVGSTMQVLKMSGDPIAQASQLGTQSKQQRQISQRPINHRISSCSWSSRIAVSREQRIEHLLLHSRMLADLLPCLPYVVAVPNAAVDFYLGLCRTAQQRDPFRRGVSLQVPHGVLVGFVDVREEQPKIHETVFRGQLIADSLHGLIVSADSRLGQQLHSGPLSTDIPHDCLHQGLQDVAVLLRIFRYNQHGKAHGAISIHPSENNSEAGLFLTASMK